MADSTALDLYNLLVTRDFEPEVLDSQGKAVTDPSQAEILSFDWKTPEKNYGTVVVLLGQDQELTVYFGDNVGRTMEGDDKKQWYRFLEQMKEFAVRNLLRFELNNLSRLKYTMQGMAAIKEGLFEGYYGTRRVSYNAPAKQSRLMIRHSRDLGEGDARYRAIESLFIETPDGERFKLPFRSLTGGRAMLTHVREGGTPYDSFGQHISQMVAEMGTMSRFIRAAKGRKFDSEAAAMVESAVRHYSDLKAKAKRMVSHRGYREARDQFNPAQFTDSEVTAEAIRDMFLERTLDHRIEEAVPVLARIAEQELKMQEQSVFEQWADDVTQGVTEDSESRYMAARYIDEFADGDQWYVKGTPDVIRRFVQLANSLEDESVKGTEYEPSRGSMAQTHAQMGDDSIPQWTAMPAQNLEQIKPIDASVLRSLTAPDLSDGVQEFMSDLLWTLEGQGRAMIAGAQQNNLSEGTWQLPDTKQQKEKLAALMSQELIVGPDAINAQEQLYDLIGDDELFDILEDLALRDPDANVWDDPKVQQRLQQLGVTDQPEPVQETLQGAPTGSGMPVPMHEIRDPAHFEVDGWRYETEEDREEDVVKTWHTAVSPEGEQVTIDFDPYDIMDRKTFGLWLKLGRPRRISGGPLDKQTIQSMARTAGVARLDRDMARAGMDEDLDTDGVMMNKPSNMSSESREYDDFRRLVELAKG